jgi:phospholipid transport system substrate-binding protein
MQIQHSRRGLLLASAAISVAAAVPARAVEEPAVIAPIQQLVAALVQVMKAGMGTPFQQRFNMLAPVIDKTFDLPAILQESVGAAAWANLAPGQQAMLLEAFRRYTVATYVNSFNQFDGQHFEVSPDTRAVGSEQIVKTKIIPRTGENHELDYVMREVGTAWRAVDVLADGSISRVAVQRSDFRRLIARGGALALADSLRAKSADLSDGAG